MQLVKIIVVCLMAIFFARHARAQYFEFSQYNFTQQRVNPAMLATFNYSAISFDYRRQSTMGGFNINSNYVNASMPLVTKGGSRKSAIGVEFLDDRTNGRSLFQTQALAVSYAYNFQMPRKQTFSVGTKILYQSKKLNLDERSVLSSDIPDRGLEESLFDDESNSEVKAGYISLNLAAYWQRTDKKGNRLLYAGVSVFDFNRPADASRGVENNLTSTVVGMAGIQAFKKNRIAFFPEVLATLQSNSIVVNIGSATQYDLNATSRLDFLTKYVSQRAVLTGIQLHRQVFSFGVSYEIPAGSKRDSNTGAFEVGLEIRKLVIQKKKRQKKVPIEKPVVVKATESKPTVKADTVQQAAPVEAQDESMNARLKHKQDSVMALAKAGALQHEALVLEKATLHFNFEFNSATLDEKSVLYLDELAQALIDNPQLKIKLVGHTDNVGSDKFNLRLSQQRAQAIKEIIVHRGVNADRIVAEGKGLREPLNNNRTKEDRNKNRRVELTILLED